jgi:hypothetical protein
MRGDMYVAAAQHPVSVNCANGDIRAQKVILARGTLVPWSRAICERIDCYLWWLLLSQVGLIISSSLWMEEVHAFIFDSVRSIAVAQVRTLTFLHKLVFLVPNLMRLNFLVSY